MDITVNGKKYEAAKGTTLYIWLKEQGANPELTACEVNSKIILRENYQSFELADGDVIEAVSIVGGG